MPIGVPRIIYCWGEELPAQWTDIYNFIFRRRMVFLMQYLDDELCNQICGLLINIHMEDRSKELEKKETERSGAFKSSNSAGQSPQGLSSGSSFSKGGVSPSGKGNNPLLSKNFSPEDLLNSDEDLGIHQIHSLEQYTLQKITTEWLNWNSSFFDYSDQPYLFYLAESLSKDFNKALNSQKAPKDFSLSPLSSPEALLLSEGFFYSKLLNLLKIKKDSSFNPLAQGALFSSLKKESLSPFFISNKPANKAKNQTGLVYSPFRKISFLFKDLAQKSLSFSKEDHSSQKFSLFSQNFLFRKNKKEFLKSFSGKNALLERKKEKTILAFLQNLAFQKALLKDRQSLLFKENSQKILGSSFLRSSYSLEKNFSSLLLDSSLSPSSVKGKGPLLSSSFGNKKNTKSFKLFNNGNFAASSGSFSEEGQFRDYYRKQTERNLIDEESKKVFMIINSFGGSVGNGITVHDALQFIKAGSLTLALGVAASASSLALAGGTIGERYVTEGCHVMIHQPESSLQGQASDIWIDSQEIMKIRLDVAEIYSLATYRPRHKILRDLDRDFYLSATETISYGLADEIATNDVMNSIIEMTSKVWDYHDGKQQRLLEARESGSSGFSTQTGN